MSRHLHLILSFWFVWLFYLETSSSQAAVRLTNTEFIAYRPGTIEVKVKKEGHSNEVIDVVVQINDPSPGGRSVFIGTSQNLRFATEGPIFEEKPTTFTIYDDGTPEPDKIYSITLKVTSGNAAVISPSVAKVIVVGSNNPFGIFSLEHNDGNTLLHEKNFGDDFLEITILRSKGHYGTVSVGLQISKCPENLTIVPTSLWVIFKNFDTARNASFELPDELPEKNVSCTFRIANVSTSDLTHDVKLNYPKIDELNSEVVIFIYPGDAFVRFSKPSYSVKIDSFSSTLQLVIYRGVHSKNNSLVVGSLKLPATVTYFILPQTAQYGIDFQAANSSLGFGPGISSVFLPISILPGNNPKRTKYFKIELKETTGNIVLSDPHIADIILVGDDATNGILSWKETNVSMEYLSSTYLVEFSAENVRNVYAWSVRHGGSLGFVSVQWELTLDQAESGAGKDNAIGIRPILGLLIFKEDETIVSINFTVANVSHIQPRPLKLYRLRMLPETVTGGAVVMLNESVLYILDRDCGLAYGVIVLNESLSFHVALESRTLEIKILRIFGLYEDVLVNFEILHSEIGTIFNGLALIPDGRDGVKVSIPLRNDVFIKHSSYFCVFIKNAKLKKELPFGPYNSPLIGNVSSVNATTLDNAANGVVRFNLSQLDVSIEQDELQTSIRVPLVRDGSFGKVKLIWRVNELEQVRAWNVSFLDDDFGNFTGSVTLVTGQSQGHITILLEKYNVTSLAERFYIEIVDWEPKSVIKLDTSAALCSVVLPELGNLAGFFKFCPWMANSFVVAVEKNSIEVCILRTGDVLVNASVLFSLEPNGDAKFYGGRTVVYFQRVEMMKIITVVARDDGIPQLNITYKLKLSPYGSRRAETDNSRNITVTVLPHSYPFGIVEFPSLNLTEALILQNDQSHYGANFTVRRFKGGFSRVSVEWMMSKMNADEKIDFHSEQGVIKFEEHQTDSSIGITFTATNMPRFSRTFTIHLINSTNGSVLGENVRAFLNVVGLDYSVHFNESIVRLFSPGSYQVEIVREGPSENKSLVKCRTQSVTALDGRDFVAVYNETFMFDVGVSVQHLNISILDDAYPRPDRTFFVVFYDVEGAIVPTNNLTVIVKAKHHSSGIFRFVPSFNKTVEKGSKVTFQVMREKGSFGKATVFYEIYNRDCNLSLTNNISTSHFSNSSGRVDFVDRQPLADLILIILEDDIPEFHVCYCIDLVRVTGGPSYDPATLSDGDLQVFLTIVPSNFPFGKIYLEPQSQQVSIAEDVDINKNNASNVSNNAKLVVLRSKGALDYKRDPHLEEFISWEVYSYQITSALTFPVVVDVLLLASKSMRANRHGSKGIRATSSEARNGTGTDVIRFDGCEGCYVSVNVDRNISLDAFSIVVWMKSFSNNDLMSGCILSKVLNTFLEYAICMRSSDPFRSDLLFYYSTNAQQSSQCVVNLQGNSISDGSWHFLVVQFSNSSIVVFLDNIFIHQSALLNLKLTSVAGDYIVGGTSSNQNNFFGSLQDLRIYGQRLNDLLMQELYMLPSRRDVESVSGYLSFDVGNQSEATINLRSVDNSVPEPNKVFTVKLLDCSGPSGVSKAEDVAILTILKSDNANGLFGLDTSCINSVQNLGPSTITCPVMRQKGTFDSVTVVWKVENVGNIGNVDDVNGYNSAGNNFLETVGSVTFEPGVILKNISLYLIDDRLPKLKQQFRLALVSVASSDGFVGSTKTSGASINPSAITCAIPLQERNFPFGFFEFSESQEKLTGNETFLRAVLRPLTVRINENTNVLRMYVIRHQGLVGGASVEWKTLEGTAKSREMSSDYDFSSSAGLLRFDPGQLSREINISIYPPKSIKSDRQFRLLLNNSQPSIGSGCGPEVTVVILASQKAFGVFGFDANSLEVHVSKDSVQINDTITAQFLVRRNTGFIGLVTLQWSMFCPSGEFNSSSFGFADFSPNQTSFQMIFKVANDGKPSLKSFCFVELLNVSQGVIDYSKSNATMMLMPSNDPYGKFVVASSSRFIQVESSDQNVSVTVERMSGVYGMVKVMHSTLTPEEFYSYLPSSVLRATKDDFRLTSGEVLFTKGQQIGYFNITIRKNYLPSLDASVFARLTAVSLLMPEQSDPVQNSPRLGASQECLVWVEIKSHDFPHGVLQLSRNEVKVPQNFSSPLGFVERSAGSVGQVSIEFEVVPDTARAGVNFVVSSHFVNFGNGETRQPLPVSVVNTLRPQLELMFFICLLNDSVTGGAVVGDVKKMLVVIERSWDVGGVFGFDEDSSILMEEDLESKLTSRLLIVRSRGSQGLVAVIWTTNSSVGARLSSPPAGQIFFLSSETKHVLTLEFSPRPIDEPIKEVVVKLVNVSNGGNLDALRILHKIRVVPTFDPYGVLQFGAQSFLLERTYEENNISLERVNGTQGSLMVYYSLNSLSLEDLSQLKNESIFIYFTKSIAGKIFDSTMHVNATTLQASSAEICARLCLHESSCLAFDYNVISHDCLMSENGTMSGDSFNESSHITYLKNTTYVLDSLNGLAKENKDFESAENASFVLPGGITRYFLGLKIFRTTEPKLEQKFSMSLLAVKLLDGDIGNPNFYPRLGSRKSELRIGASNDPRGLFTIYHWNGGVGNATGESITRYVVVEQRPDYSVLLTVDRQAGLLGSVSVDWFIDAIKSTAVNGLHFSANGVTLTFTPGVKMQVVSIGILKYDSPSDDKSIVIGLKNARGGARIAESESSVTVVLAAHDFVAGIIAFQDESAVAEEGGINEIEVVRSPPGVGTVIVCWNIVARYSNQTEAAQRFTDVEGSITFAPNDLSKNITLNVTLLQEPAVDDQYLIQLVNATTFGVRPSGEAAIDAKRGIFLLTIKGGNNPHGVFSFVENFQEVVVEAENGTVELQVARKFGLIGDVLLSYSILSGSVQKNNEDAIPAIANLSFVEVQNGVVVCKNAQNWTNISVTLFDDGQSRPNEVISVSLISAKLTFPSAYHPRLASAGTSAQVIIMEREGAYGVVIFRPPFVRMTVSSLVGNLTIEAYRSRGLYRNVSVFCFAQPIPGAGGAISGVDYNFKPTVLTFQRGMDKKNISIEILASDLPKPERSLQLVFSNPTNGLILGLDFRATITILANGQMAGSVAFQTFENISMKPNSLPYLTSVFLPLFRGLGASGVINIPYIISLLGSLEIGTAMKILPMSGVVTFRDKQTLAWLSLRVSAEVIDSTSSDELYMIELLPPDGGAVLSSPSRKFIRVFRKGSPFGLVQLYFSQHSTLRHQSIQLESSFIELNVVRTVGTRSKVSVDVSLVPSMISSPNIQKEFKLTFFQMISNGSSQKWYQYDAYGSSYMLTFGSNCGQISVYRWQGSFVFVQSLEVDFAVAVNHGCISNKTYLFLVNGKLSGASPSKSKLYQVQTSGMLLLVQEIPTTFASDALIISSQSSVLLLVLYYQDRSSRTMTVSKVYLWNADVGQFATLNQNIATKGARHVALFKSSSSNITQFSERTYIVITNYFDSDYNSYDVESIVYSLDVDGQLLTHQKIHLTAADFIIVFDDFAFSSSQSIPLSSADSNVFASFLHEFNKSVTIYIWESESSQFIFFQKLSFDRIHSISTLADPYTYEKLLMVASDNRSTIYQLQKSIPDNIPLKFSKIWEHDVRLTALTVVQSSSVLTFVAQSSNIDCYFSVEILAAVDDATSLFPNLVTVSFEEGQTSQKTFMSVIPNQLRDTRMTFNLTFTNPKFGVEVGSNDTLEIDVEPNASIDGIFQFSQDSLDKIITRYQNQSSSCLLRLQRLQGFRGAYVISWRIKATTDIEALFVSNMGRVDFLENQTESLFTVILSSGSELYFDVYVDVLLYNLTALDSQTRNSRGLFSLPAKLGTNVTARIKIQAKEAVYGIFGWEFQNFSTSEVQFHESSSFVSLSIVRQQGALGRVKVFYLTEEDVSAPFSSRAQPWKDYIPVNSSVTFENGMRKVLVNVTILKSSEPELTETFLVKLLSLELLPDVLITGGQNQDLNSMITVVMAHVFIEEHGNPRGSVQFYVERDVEGRMDVDEGDQISLSITRSSLLGSLQVEWVAVFIASSSLSSQLWTDVFKFVQPQSGVVNFDEGQQQASIELKTIKVDGDFSFRVVDVLLSNVKPNGGSLGEDLVCRIGIKSSLPRYSSISILPSQVELKRSRFPDDPEGQVTLNVLRNGISREVIVTWRLEVIGQSKFNPPYYGDLTFKIGEVTKQIKLQSKMSPELRGKEVINLSLVGVSEGSLLNPLSKSSRLIILPDIAILGYVTINDNSRSVVVTRPQLGIAEGELEIGMTRVAGFCGELKVAWKILPSGSDEVFFHNNGEVIMHDLQTEAVVTLTVLESLEPNLLEEFTFQITSAVSSRTETSKIFLLPSNYPYGWFSFETPSSISVDRTLQSYVSIKVLRKFGVSGNVKVFYKTMNINGSSLYVEEGLQNWIAFEDDVKQKSILIQLRNSTLPMGLSIFQVNLTAVEPMFAIQNKFLVPLNNLVTIGSPHLSTITLEPDVDAGGVVQFKFSRLSAFRDFSLVSLPFTRGPGTYRDVRIYYMASGVSARPGDDFYPDEGWVWVKDGSSGGTINISLVFDGRIKPSSQFVVRIVEVSDPFASLGPNVDCLVTIEKSDYSYGRFGFLGLKVVKLPNLDILSSVTLSVERTVSFLSEQKVFWQIFDSRTGVPPNDTSDVALVGVEIEELSSSLEWRDGEGGKKSFSLLVKPHVGWELEERFTLKITKIETRDVDRTASIDPLNSEVTMIIDKFGYLNGLLRFETTTGKYFEEPAVGQTVMQFIVLRTLGTYGDIEIEWMLSGFNEPSKDFSKTSGLLAVKEGRSVAYIDLILLRDDEDEFDETFALTMTTCSGGADIDRNYSSVSFTIRGHGFPCGMFSFDPSLQKFVVEWNPLGRKIILNVSRSRGLSMSVMTRISLTYDQAENNLLYTNSREFTVIVSNQTSWKSIEVDVNLDVFISSKSSFTACIISLEVLDGNVSIKPIIDSSKKCANIPIVDEAGNSEIGFQMESVPVDYETQTSKIAVQRYGSFGSVQVDWSVQRGKPPAPFNSFILSDLISPSFGSVSMTHGQSFTDIKVKLSSDPSRKEMYMLILQKFTSQYKTQFMSQANLTCIIQPDGVVSISDKQLNMSVQQQDTEETRISINLVRSFGSLTETEVWFSAYKFASGSDYEDIQYGKVLFNIGQTTAVVTVKVNPYISSSGYFVVNLTLVRRSGGRVYEGSQPQLAPNKSRSVISFKGGVSSYGVLSIKQLQPFANWAASENVSFLVSRSGGSLGSALVNVRSVGGGEPWDAIFGRFPTPDNDTIAAFLSKRDSKKRAYAGADYKTLDVLLDFKEDKNEFVNLTGLNFAGHESVDKEIFVYLRPLTAGLRVARPSQDNLLEGYSVVKIQFDSRWKEVIGFVVINSSHLVGDEDLGVLDLVMTVDRTNGTLYPGRTVLWKALAGSTSPGDVLQQMSGMFNCGSGEEICFSHLLLKDDNISRNATWLLIELTLNQEDAMVATIDEGRKFCNLTLKENDFPHGKVEFATDSRNMFVSQTDKECQLMLERTGFLNKAVSLTYSIFSPLLPMVIAGVEVLPAVDRIHYSRTIGSISFSAGVKMLRLDVPLKTSSVQFLKSPVQLQIRLENASSGCIIGESLSNVTVSNDADYNVWNLWSQVTTAQSGEFISRTLFELNNLVKSSNFSKTMATVSSQMIRYISSSFNASSFSKEVKTSVVDVLCSSARADRLDAFRGFLAMVETLGLFAASLLPSDDSCSDEMMSSALSSCSLITFVVKHIKVKDIETMSWKHFEDVGSLTLSLQNIFDFSSSEQCSKVLLVIYKSLLWFRTSDADLNYLNNKLIYFNTYSNGRQEALKLVKNIFYSFKTNSLPSQLSKCVICGAEASKCPAYDVCQLENNLVLGTAHQVDCTCSAPGGALGVVMETDGLLYPIWFHSSCLFVVVSCAVVLSVHLFVQSSYGTIVKLLLQMILAVLLLQLTYVVNVFLSPRVILGSPTYPCIVTSIVVHFFYVSQFVWIVLQIYKLYGVLHLNKDTSSISFMKNSITAWGLTAFLVGSFHLSSFLIYKFAMDTPFDKFYGDVTGNKDVCFMTNLYAALVGVFFIQLITAVAVVMLLHRCSTSWEQWKNYDDIYKNNKNSFEFILAVILWLLVIATCFFGGLHLIVRQQWILIIFATINMSLGIYVFIVYGLLRCFESLQTKMKRVPHPNDSKFIRIKNIKRRNLSNIELVPNANEFSNNTQDNYEHKELGNGSTSSNDLAEHGDIPATDLPSEFESPVHNFKELTERKVSPKIWLQRANSEISFKPHFPDDEDFMHFQTMSSSPKKNFLDDQQIDDLLSVIEKNCSDLGSVRSLSLEDLNKKPYKDTNTMSDIFF